MSNFTPGPWHTERGDWAEGRLIVWDEAGDTICRVDQPVRIRGRRERVSKTEDNARLIAAAPDLLEALKAAQEELSLLRSKDTATVYDPTLRARISLALTKAEEK